jgi:hypothetical protein
MLNLNLRTLASGAAALALTVVMSWTFVDATKLANLYRDSASPSFVAAISALVR